MLPGGSSSPLKAALRRSLPPSILRRYDRLRLEAPVRLRDFPADAFERLRPSRPSAVPPAWLRAHVGRTSSRDEYLRVGRAGFEEVLAAFRSHHDPARSYPRWLDFGCGCGRLCRHLLSSGVCASYVGADVDDAAIHWNEKNLAGGEFVCIGPAPPTRLRSGEFDVVVCVSVFTHLDQPLEARWLGELARLLGRGGLFIASTHSDALSGTRPDLSPAGLERLTREGFTFAPGAGRFNDDTAFHSRAYLERTWGRHLQLVAFSPYGLFHFQDLSVWRKP